MVDANGNFPNLGPLSRLGVVIPTMGTREEFLVQTIDSLTNMQERPFLLLAGPSSAFSTKLAERGKVDLLVSDFETLPVAEKIHRSFLMMPDHIEFLTWIGDDDLFYARGYELAISTLDKMPNTVMVYGPCRYIDSRGNPILLTKPGKKAEKVLSWGPQLISQPSTVYRRTAYLETGGLSGYFTRAFDFDLFLKLKKLGQLTYTGAPMSAWRWHDDSMTVRKRWLSVSEASRARMKNRLCSTWLLLATDLPVRLVTYFAGKALALLIRLKNLH